MGSCSKRPTKTSYFPSHVVPVSVDVAKTTPKNPSSIDQSIPNLVVFFSSATHTSQVPVDSITHVLALPAQPSTLSCQPPVNPYVLDFQPPTKITKLKPSSFSASKAQSSSESPGLPSYYSCLAILPPELHVLSLSNPIQVTKFPASHSRKHMYSDLAITNLISSLLLTLNHLQIRPSKPPFADFLSTTTTPPVSLKVTTLPMGSFLPPGESQR